MIGIAGCMGLHHHVTICMGALHILTFTLTEVSALDCYYVDYSVKRYCGERRCIVAYELETSKSCLPSMTGAWHRSVLTRDLVTITLIVSVT